MVFPSHPLRGGREGAVGSVRLLQLTEAFLDALHCLDDVLI